MQDYLDFDLRLERFEGGYRAVVINSPAGHGARAFVLPFSQDRLQLYLLQIGQRRGGVRRADSPGARAAREFGGSLFETVFAGEVRDRWYQSLAEASRQGRGLRIRLRLNDAPELADVPWEYLHDPSHHEFLLLSAGTPLAHYLELPERIRPLTVQPPLRALVMVSSPGDYDPLDVEKEWSQLEAAVAPLTRQGLLAVDRLARPTLSALQSQLRKAEYHIFHFIGHGGFETQPGAPEGVLVVEDENGRGRKVSGRDLAIYLKDEETLRLAVLNCCEGARTSGEDIFAGVAQTLIRRGVPAVIAMQFEISDTAAVQFAAEFYRALADGWPVDAALAEARKSVYGAGNALEWGAPVLHLRAPDGRIFDLAPPEKPPIQVQITGLLKEAGAALERQQWPLAIGKCEAALALQPGHPQAADLLSRARAGQECEEEYQLGARHFEAGRWEQAVATLQSVVHRQPGYRDAASLLERAKTRWRENLVGPPPERFDRRAVSHSAPAAATARGGSCSTGGEIPQRAPRRRPVLAIAVPALIAVLGAAGVMVWKGGLPSALKGSGETPTTQNPSQSSAPGEAVERPIPPPAQGWQVITAGTTYDATDAEIAAWIQDRRVGRDTRVRRMPGGAWAALRDVPELAGLLPDEPRVPPPQQGARPAASTASTGDRWDPPVTAASHPSPGAPAPDSRPDPQQQTERTLRPARMAFVPVSNPTGVGYWKVRGWEQDPGSTRREISGTITFNALNSFATLLRYDGEPKTGEGGWQYDPLKSTLHLSFLNTAGMITVAQLQVKADENAFILEGLNYGTRTRLRLEPATMADVAREAQSAIEQGFRMLMNQD